MSFSDGEKAQEATRRAEFLAERRALEQDLFDQGYTFAGNIRPPRISGRSYDDEEVAIAEMVGVPRSALAMIGDVMSTYDSDPKVRELWVMYDYVAAYAPPKV